jgi:heat shock protein HtpX
MKRIMLFILTNLAVMLVLTVVTRLLGVDRFLTANGLNLGSLLAFSAVIGFGGATISLLMSKWMAKMSTGAQVISHASTADEQWLLDTVQRLSRSAGIGMPEVAVYEGEPNAFATGAFRNEALIAVSTGLLQSMNRDEIEAVLAHEVAHVANGDMVTLTLIQGVVNTFVVFLSRVVGYFVDRVILKNDRDVGMGYYITSIVCEIVFGIAASAVVAWFSRQREFRADAGAALYMGTPSAMISALGRLGQLQAGELPKNMAASGIAGGGLMAMFSSHPPLEARIARLQQR